MSCSNAHSGAASNAIDPKNMTFGQAQKLLGLTDSELKIVQNRFFITEKMAYEVETPEGHTAKYEIGTSHGYHFLFSWQTGKATRELQIIIGGPSGVRPSQANFGQIVDISLNDQTLNFHRPDVLDAVQEFCTHFMGAIREEKMPQTNIARPLLKILQEQQKAAPSIGQRVMSTLRRIVPGFNAHS